MAPPILKLPAVIEVYGDVQFNATGAADVIPLYDTGPGIAIGAQAFISVFIWLIFLFVYTPQDSISNGLSTFPVAWMWENISSGTQGWMAASYMFNFWCNLLVGGGELIAFLLFSNGMPWFSYIWTPYVGYYGSIFLYLLSPIFALVHMTQPTLSGGLAKISRVDDYANDIFLMSVGLVHWAFTAIAHVQFTDRYVAHGHAKYDKVEEKEEKVEEIEVVDANKDGAGSAPGEAKRYIL